MASIQHNGKTEQLEYDANGNLVKDGTTAYIYNAENQLANVRAGDKELSFDYLSTVRYRQTVSDGHQRSETLYIGGLEVRTELSPLGAKLSRSFVFYVRNNEGPVALVVRDTNAASALVSSTVLYPVFDQLGSLVRLTNASGKVVSGFKYDSWGARSAPGGLAAAYGFTSHEHLQFGQLIHMNGRVYSARIGTFISADPVGMDLIDPGTLGRYRYARNNPLRYTDPAGYWSLGGAIGGAIGGFFSGGPGGAIVGALIGGNDETREFVEAHWREAVIVGVAVGATVATGGACATVCGAMVSGMAAGAASGATAAALYGGNIDDVLTAGVKGGAIGAVSGVAFYGVGSAFSGEAGAINASDSIGAVAAHGAVGGTMSTLQGANFWTGFLSGAATKGAEAWMPPVETLSSGIARAALVGGTVSVISGGKFANGAVIGVFSFSFNCLLHNCLAHYLGRTEGPIKADFSELGVDEFPAEKFPKLKRALELQQADGKYPFEETAGWQTKSLNSKLSYGRVTLKVTGTITIENGRTSFTGRLSALPDRYDFNPDSSRGFVPNALTWVGSLLPGKPYQIEFSGSRDLNWTPPPLQQPLP